jgi:hypothetical protein
VSVGKVNEERSRDVFMRKTCPIKRYAFVVFHLAHSIQLYPNRDVTILSLNIRWYVSNMLCETERVTRNGSLYSTSWLSSLSSIKKLVLVSLTMFASGQEFNHLLTILSGKKFSLPPSRIYG